MALKFDMSRGDYRDIFSQINPQSAPSERMYQAGENIGTALAEMGKQYKTHISPMGKAYQKYLASFEGKPFTGAGGKIGLTPPQSFQVFANEKRDLKQKQRLMEKVEDSGQLGVVKRHMKKTAGFAWSADEESGRAARQPTDTEVEEWLHKYLPQHKSLRKDLRTGFREKTFEKRVKPIMDFTQKSYTNIDKGLLSGILPGGYRGTSKEGDKAYAKYLAEEEENRKGMIHIPSMSANIPGILSKQEWFKSLEKEI